MSSNLNPPADEEATSSSTVQQAPSLSLHQQLKPPLKLVGSGTTALSYSAQAPAWSCSFHPSGEWLAIGYGAPDVCIRIYHYSKGTLDWGLVSTLTGVHERTIRTVSFASLMKPLVLAAGSFDGTISIWEQETATVVYSGSKQKNLEWECTAQLEGHDNEVKCVVWNATSTLLATCGRDKTVWLWECFLTGSVGGTDGGDYECIAVLNGHEADVKSVQFAAAHGKFGDGEEIALSSSYDDTVKVWAEDAGDWYCALSIGDVHADTIWSIAVSPSSGRFVSASADGSIGIFKAYSKAEKKERFPDESPSSR